MRKLVIINNKGGNSTVLNALLKYIISYFDEVVIVTPKISSNSRLNNVKGIKIRELSRLDIFGASIKGVMALLFDRTVHFDLKKASIQKKLDINYIKTYIHYLVKGIALSDAASNFINKDNQVITFSTWYSENAYAVARLKKRNPLIVAMSYAHSYEVDWRKNSYVGLIMDTFKNKWIDEICFISQNVMQEYLETERDNVKIIDKFQALHFGSEKLYEGVCEKSKDGILRIMTCSGISKVKRLDLIVDALNKYNGSRLEWTHLGDGNLFQEISKSTQKIKNPLIKINFKGRVANSEVHKYYTENYVDLFINVSASEGLPVSIMEAMSYGVPVLATDVGGNSEIVNKDNGWLVSAQVTSDDLCMLLEEIALGKQNDNKRTAAYKTWDENYRIENNVNILIDHMERKRREIYAK